MTEKPGENDGADLDEIAASWFHRLSSMTAADAAETRRLFQAWIDASPDHAEAFVRTTAIWHEIGAHAATPEMMSLRQASIEDARRAAQARWRPVRQAPPSRWPAVAAAAFAVAGGIGICAYLYLKPAPTQVYATDVGERHSVTLSDNSRVDIDADSAISVEYTADRRLVTVTRGQAYFEVEKDQARPFVVESNGRSVTATGTAFNVEDLTGGVQVTLVKGHVIVRHVAADAGAGETTALEPGDQLTDVPGSPPRLVHLVNTLPATAWRQGKLLFDNEPLPAAIERVQRYSHVKILADPSLARIRIGGAFDAGDVRAFVDAVTTYYPVEVSYEGSGALRLVARKSPHYSH